MDYKTGRISEIIQALNAANPDTVLKELPVQIKLNALCGCLQMSADELDRLIVENSPVLRTVKGHAFESFFDQLMKDAGQEVEQGGGDTPVDRKINGHTLQLKTPTAAGTTGDFVQFKTHKTHGAKSELESFDYYHQREHFADFLVGLVSYDPLNILIIPKADLPCPTLSPQHIQSPCTLNYRTHSGLNNFSQIGLLSLPADLKSLVAGQHELLPRCAVEMTLNTDVILNTILNNSNFRIWDMAIRGFAREAMFQKFLALNDVATWKPSAVRRSRPDKADHALQSLESGEYQFFQMKGLSVGNCRFTNPDPILGVETQLTRGRVNDHETQSRLYRIDDFDFLVIGVDPPMALLYQKAIGIVQPSLEWEFYAIPTSNLGKHPEFPNRLKSVQRFSYSAVQKYRIREEWSNKWTSTSVDEAAEMDPMNVSVEVEENLEIDNLD